MFHPHDPVMPADGHCAPRAVRFFDRLLRHEWRAVSHLFGFVLQNNTLTTSLAIELKALSEVFAIESVSAPGLFEFDSATASIRLARSVTLATVCVGSLVPMALALPTGYQSTSGNVQFNQSGDTLNITSSAQRSIATYQNFNVAGHETVNFSLPHQSAAILNRVTGGNASQIMGRVNSNGQVFIVNPAGIVFGQGAQVNVGGLHASTLNIKDADFLEGHYAFKQDGANSGITNEGAISAQAVTLIGSVIDNKGTITASAGQVNLAVGESVTMVVDEGLSVAVTVDEVLQSKVVGYNTAIHNSGSISTPGGVITAQAKLQGGLYEKALNNEGILEARGLDGLTGSVNLAASSSTQDALVRNAGSIDVSGTVATPNAGNVTVLGDFITQRGTLLAEGLDLGVGGHIYLASTQGTLLTQGSNTSAKGSGAQSDAGEVLIWSDGTTYFRNGAVIDVSGGNVSGDAGFVEVSARDTVYYQGQARGYATNGLAGSILIDPIDIIIDNTGADTVDGGDAAAAIDESFAEGNATETYNPQNGGAFAGFADIWLQATNDITINSAFNTSTATGNANVSLKLEANNDINVNANLTTNNAALTLSADKDASGTGSVALNANLASGGGAITLTGASITGTGSVNSTSGTISITTSGANRPISTGTITGGNVTLQTNGSNSPIAVTGDVNSSGGLTLRSSATNSNVSVTGNITASSAGVQDLFLVSGVSDFTLGGTLSIPTKTNKSLNIIVGGGNLFTNSFFNQSLPLWELDWSVYGDNMPITVNGNLGLNGTTSQIHIKTYGINSPITINGDATSWLILNLVASYSDVVITGNVNMNYSLGGQRLTLISGWSNEYSDTVNNSNASVSVGGNINCTVNDPPNWARVHIYTGAGNIFSKPFFNQTFTMDTLNLKSAADNMPITVTGNFTNSGITDNGFNITTLGANSPITYNGNINAQSDQLVLSAIQSDVTVNGNITYTNPFFGIVRLNAGWDYGTVANSAANFNISGTLNIPNSGLTGHTYITTGGGNIFASNYFTSDHGSHTYFLTFKSAADNTPIHLGGNFASSYGIYVETQGVNSSITQTAGKTLTSTTAYTNGIWLTTQSSDIGTVGTPISTTSNNLHVNSTSGDAVLTNTGAVTLNDSTVGGDFILSNNNTITVSGEVIADNLTLQTTANNGNISLGANLTGTTSLSLTANGSGVISQSAGTLTSNTLSLDSTSGTIGTSGARIYTATSNLTANTSGNVYVTEANALTLGASTGNTFDLTTSANGAITLGGNITAATLDLTAQGSGDIVYSSGTLTGTSLTLTSASGAIGTIGSRIQTSAGTLTANTTGNVYVNEANAVTLGASTGSTFDITTSANGVISLGGNVTATTLGLTADGSGDIVYSSGTLNATNVNLASTSGTIGTSGSRIQTSAGTLTANTSNNIYLTNSGSLSLGTSTSLGTLDILNDDTLTLSGTLSGNTVNLTTTGALLDGNTVGPDLVATAGASLSAAYVGTLVNPLDIQVSGGLMSVTLSGISGILSGNFAGSVAPVDSLSLLNSPLGQVWYNGFLSWTPPSPPSLATNGPITIHGSTMQSLELLYEEAYKTQQQPHVDLMLLNHYIVPRIRGGQVLYQQEWAHAIEDLNIPSDDDVWAALLGDTVTIRHGAPTE